MRTIYVKRRPPTGYGYALGGFVTCYSVLGTQCGFRENKVPAVNLVCEGPHPGGGRGGAGDLEEPLTRDWQPSGGGGIVVQAAAALEQVAVEIEGEQVASLELAQRRLLWQANVFTIVSADPGVRLLVTTHIQARSLFI